MFVDAVRHRIIVAALVVGLAILPAFASASSDDPAAFAKQRFEHVFKGDGGWLYDHLHPAQRKLVSYDDFNICLHATLAMVKGFGADLSQDKVTRVTTGKQSFVRVPGTRTVSRAVAVTVYYMNSKHPGKADRSAGHIFFTKEGLRWAMDADEIAKQRKGKCL